MLDSRRLTLLLCLAGAVMWVGCSGSQTSVQEETEATGETTSTSAPVAKGTDLLSRLQLSGHLQRGRAEWDGKTLELSVDGTETEVILPHKIPRQYELTLEATAPQTPAHLTVYAPLRYSDALIPLKIQLGATSGPTTASVAAGQPIRVVFRVWRHHAWATVNDKVIIAHGGDLDELAEIATPRMHVTLPSMLRARGAAVRVTSFRLRNLEHETPDFTPRTRTAQAKLGRPWPFAPKYWLVKPAQTHDLQQMWKGCDLSVDETQDGVRLHATSIRGGRAFLVHRGVLRGDFRLTLRFHNELAETGPRDEKSLLSFKFEPSVHTQGYAARNFDFPEPRNQEHELEIRRTGGEIEFWFDGRYHAYGKPEDVLDADGHLAIELRNGTCLRIKSLLVRCEGSFVATLPEWLTPPTEAQAPEPEERPQVLPSANTPDNSRRTIERSAPESKRVVRE